MPPQVYIAGNFWIDNLVLLREIRPGLEKELNQSDPVIVRKGGTYALKLFVQAALEADADDVTIVPLSPKKPIQVYWLWRKYTKELSSENQEYVWRIEAPLGIQLAEDPKPSKVPECDLLIIDNPDVAEGTVSQGWPTNCDWESIKNVILRPGQSSLSMERCKQLSKLEGLQKKLTIVLPAASARAWGANIPIGRYWGNTLTHIKDAFTGDGPLSIFKDVKRTIISFPYGGIVTFEGGHATEILMAAEELEDTWKHRHPGHFSGTASFIVACVARHLLKKNFTLKAAMEAALHGSTLCHLFGGGPVTKTPSDSWQHAADLLTRVLKGETSGHFVHVRNQDLMTKSLFDICCTREGGTHRLAKEIILHGLRALRVMPRMVYGSYVAVDPDEIERLHFLRGLVQEYLDRPKDKIPLGICVLGDPGSGKSFIIEELVKSVLGAHAPILTFNMAQLGEPSHEIVAMALHRVRDYAVRGEIPVLFFDEFDAYDLKWLQYFLAPLQDAKFWQDGLFHPIGRSIFVFAGGTKARFEEFALSTQETPDSVQSLKQKKVPDFVSRIRGFLNVVGPNCTDVESSTVHLLRRAILIRALLQKNYAHLIDSEGTALIDVDVVDRFLDAKRFTNGARSIETILTSSRLARARKFTSSALPPKEQIRMHVTQEFYDGL